MPSIKRKHRRERREWSDHHVLQLRVGHDFFRDAFGNVFDFHPDARDDWPGAEVLAEMKACWLAHRDELLADPDRPDETIDRHRPFFAELVFERGMTPREAMQERSRLHNERMEEYHRWLAARPDNQ